LIRGGETFVLQLAGAPGSGKSTLARAIATKVDVVVLDLDIIKSAVLSVDPDFQRASRVGYEVLWATLESLVIQGFSVVVDSPCNYQEVLDNSMRIAAQHGARFGFVECRVEDVELLDARLRTRPTQRSQQISVEQRPMDAPSGQVDPAELFHRWIFDIVRPAHGYIQLDTQADINRLAEAAIEYIASLVAPERR
jgi:predicted kinase